MECHFSLTILVILVYLGKCILNIVFENKSNSKLSQEVVLSSDSVMKCSVPECLAIPNLKIVEKGRNEGRLVGGSLVCLIFRF